MQDVKGENALLKLTQTEVHKELKFVKEERDRLRKDTKSLKNVNLALGKDLIAVNTKELVSFILSHN